MACIQNFAQGGERIRAKGAKKIFRESCVTVPLKNVYIILLEIYVNVSTTSYFLEKKRKKTARVNILRISHSEIPASEKNWNATQREKAFMFGIPNNARAQPTRSQWKKKQQTCFFEPFFLAIMLLFSP